MRLARTNNENRTKQLFRYNHFEWKQKLVIKKTLPKTPIEIDYAISIDRNKIENDLFLYLSHS